MKIDTELLRKQIIELESLISHLPDEHVLWGALALLEAIYDNEVK